MGMRVIHVMTHDSIGLGEDGPTHQPVEHLASLRAMPNLLVLRPADAVETAECWEGALRADPSVLACRGRDCRRRGASRRRTWRARRLCSGAPEGGRNVTMIATGSEVSIAMRRGEAAGERRRPRRRRLDAVLGAVPPASARLPRPRFWDGAKVGVEAAVEGDWARWLGEDGVFVGMTGFGASAPAEVLYREFGITADAVAKAALRCMARSRMAAAGS